MSDDGIEIKIDASKFRKELEALGKDFEKKAINAATAAAAQIFKKAVTATAPRLSVGTDWRTPGTLARAVYEKCSERVKGGAIRYFIGIRSGRGKEKKKTDAFYWYFLEHGWLPRGRKGKLKGGNESRAQQRKQAIAGGAKQSRYKFIAPAFKRVESKAVKVFEDTITKYLAKANRK